MTRSRSFPLGMGPGSPWAGEVRSLLRSGDAVAVVMPVSGSDTDLHLLPEAEQTQAHRFTHLVARDAFIRGRVVIRSVLEPLIGEVLLERGVHGKPYCTHPAAPAFNLSHAAGAVAALFAPVGPVGIDVEDPSRIPAHPERLAARVFTPEEQERLRQGDVSFLSLWTRKEAVLKSMGTGFAGHAGQVDADHTVGDQKWQLGNFSSQNLVGAVCLPAGVAWHLLRLDPALSR